MSEPLRALIEQWRKDSQATGDGEGNYYYSLALRQCADELEAALSAVPVTVEQNIRGEYFTEQDLQQTRDGEVG